MSRAIVTLAVGEHAELLEVALPSMRALALEHGHQLIVDCHPGIRPSRPPSWWKIPAIARALATHDEVLWLDADVVIADWSEDLTAPAGAWQAMVEHHTDDGLIPNCGVWLLRRPMLPVLHELWEMVRHINSPWWEQSALLELLGYCDLPVRRRGRPNELLEHTHFLENGWNVHRQDRRDSGRIRILHATTYPDRLAVMRGWAELPVGGQVR